MGKNIIQQARGKGGPRYRAPSFRYRGEAKHHTPSPAVMGTITDFVHCAGHSVPLAEVQYEDGEKVLMLAPEGIRVGQQVSTGSENVEIGNTLSLSSVPVGTLVNNIESQPGDGGRFCRSGGSFAKVVEVSEKKVVIELPSKKKKTFNPSCRATIGVLSAGGRTEKPLMKAGRAHFKAKAKNKLYPRIAGNAQNAVDHPFGKSSTHTKGRPLTVPKNAPAGRKVGLLRASRTGRKKR